jgi:hypothetical protein
MATTENTVQKIVEDGIDQIGGGRTRGHAQRWRRTSETTFEVTVMNAGVQTTGVITFPEAPPRDGSVGKTIKRVNSDTVRDSYHRAFGSAMYGISDEPESDED